LQFFQKDCFYKIAGFPFAFWKHFVVSEFGLGLLKRWIFHDFKALL
jgi:hypothetical protein